MSGTSWGTIDLGPLLDGGTLEEPPSLLPRKDGVHLLYAGKLHTIQGEPESGKGWLALLAAAQLITAGDHVLYIDFEDSPNTIVSRLRGLAVDDDGIRTRLHYMRPNEPLSEDGWEDIEAALAYRPPLAVLDGVTEALALHGLDLTNNSDVADWLELLPRRVVRTGTAVAQLDHVVKVKEGRGRYAIGAQHKLAGVDVAYNLESVEPFGRGKDGRSNVVVAKDRHGHVRQHAVAKVIAELHLLSDVDGAVLLELRAPTAGSERSAFRPTALMERLSRAIEDEPGITKRALRDVQGKNDAKDLALRLLIGEQHVDLREEGKAHRHYSLRPYREEEEAKANESSTVPPCPDRAPTVPPARGDATVPPCPTPYRGARDGAHHEHDGNEPTVPFPEPDLFEQATADEAALAERIRADHGDVGAQSYGAPPSSNGARAGSEPDPADQLIGVKAVLAMGIPGLKHRQQLKRRRDAGTFLKPDVETDSGPLWHLAKVEAWGRGEAR
jgi:hypothetical protein